MPDTVAELEIQTREKKVETLTLSNTLVKLSA